MADGEPIPEDILDRMSPDVRTEALAILDRLRPADDPEAMRREQLLLLHAAQIEADVRSIRDDGDPAVARKIRSLLREVEKFRSRITGLPPAHDDPPGT